MRVREWTSATGHPGRQFAPTVERELFPALRDLAARLPGAGAGVWVIGDMPGPNGLPDLLAVPVTPALLTRLAHPCPPLVAWADARLVAACWPSRAIAVETLARKTAGRVDAVRRRVRRLITTGALIEPRPGLVCRAGAVQPVGRLYALEAKVASWSAGFGQALRYGTWADASAVVVARLPTDRTSALAQARDLGIGLALGREWLVRPRVRELDPATRLWASEHVVAALEHRRSAGAESAASRQ
jgi:hypothetical protein